jgi:ubiquinone/menaquinone biosynthesis C-methylase UbiE
MSLEQSGERYHPEIRGVIRYEHLHRYALCLDMVDGLDVLDIACGEGYGSAMLASRAKRVVGVDIEHRAVEHARHTYYHPNVRYLAGDCAAIPAADDSFDVVVSFETLEHVGEQDQMLSEIRRVLRPGGRLVISSPNKLVYSDEVHFTNPYHVRELYYDEFVRLLERHFASIRIHGQRLAAASFVFPLVERFSGGLASYGANGGETREGLPPLERPLYFIAICGDDEAGLGSIDSLFLDAHEDLLQMLQLEHQRALQQIASDQHAIADRGHQFQLEAAQNAPGRLEGSFDVGLERGELDALRERLAIASSDASAVAERDAIAADRDSIAAYRDAVLADRDSIAAHRDALIAHAASLEAERNALSERVEAFRSEREAAVAERSISVSEDSAQAAELSALLTERGHWLNERDAVVAERDTVAAALAAATAELAAVTAERDRFADERGAQTRRREDLQAAAEAAREDAARAERERAELHSDRARVQRRAESMLRELENLRKRLDVCQTQLADLTTAHEALRGAHEALRVAHEGIFSSRSWRVTAPLRAITNTVRRKPSA